MRAAEPGSISPPTIPTMPQMARLLSVALRIAYARLKQEDTGIGLGTR